MTVSAVVDRYLLIMFALCVMFVANAFFAGLTCDEIAACQAPITDRRWQVVYAHLVLAGAAGAAMVVMYVGCAA